MLVDGCSTPSRRWAAGGRSDPGANTQSLRARNFRAVATAVVTATTIVWAHVAASTGINVAGAIRLAKQLGPGHTIVTILADTGGRYQSKLFNPAFLRSKGLPVPEWLEKKPDVKVPYE